MQKLQTVNAETLLYEPLEKPSFVVDSLIPTGLSLFCGSQKIGKSWLMLKLCLCVSQGIPLWDMPTMEGDVLYLCLEDTFCRIQDRLFRLTDEASGRLHFAVASCKLSDGLIVQLEDYLKDYPDSRLIVIDTLQKVRTASKDNAYLGMSDAEYRKTLVELRKKIRIIENHLREKDYSFDYAKQPSKAMFKYRKAFLRNDGERYNEFLEAVSSGEKQLHADNLAPYEIVRSALDANRWGFNARLTDGEKAALNASWASLPDFCDNRNALAVVDTSGSMYCYDNALPAAVALSLGLYFGERNTGIFHNHFIEFSSRPQLIEIKGKTFAERLEYLCTFNEVADTNVEAVFDLILDAAVRNNVPQEELPETLYLISDMEFNACVRNASVSNFASAKRRFAEHGYRLPQIVFWNVASRNSNQPVTKNEQGVALVSGCTPRLFSMVASGDLSPYSVMMDIIKSERYAKISA